MKATEFDSEFRARLDALATSNLRGPVRTGLPAASHPGWWVVSGCGLVVMVLGLLTRVVSALMGVVMIGAAGFVHAAHGIFVAQGGWELVGAIGAALAGLAVAGPGRLSLSHLLAAIAARPAPATAPSPSPPASAVAFADPRAPGATPPAGLPLVPVVRVTPSPVPRIAQSMTAGHHGSRPVG